MSPEGTIGPGELRILGQRETQRQPIVVRFSKVPLNEINSVQFLIKMIRMNYSICFHVVIEKGVIDVFQEHSCSRFP